MTNKAPKTKVPPGTTGRAHRSQRQSARAALKKRPAGELKVVLRIVPPEGERDNDQPVELFVDLRNMTGSERQLAKRALEKMTAVDMTEVVLVHAWVVWRRTHSESSLQTWMDDTKYGEILDGMDVEPGHVEWDTTPEGFDPEALGVG